MTPNDVVMYLVSGSPDDVVTPDDVVKHDDVVTPVDVVTPLLSRSPDDVVTRQKRSTQCQYFKRICERYLVELVFLALH